MCFGGGSCRSSGLFVGERLDSLSGAGFRAVQDMRYLVGQGESKLIAIGGERGVVGLQLGGFTLEGGVQGRELRHGFLGQGEALRVNFDADRLVAENHLMPGPRKERSEVAAH